MTLLGGLEVVLGRLDGIRSHPPTRITDALHLDLEARHQSSHPHLLLPKTQYTLRLHYLSVVRENNHHVSSLRSLHFLSFSGPLRY